MADTLQPIPHNPTQHYSWQKEMEILEIIPLLQDADKLLKRAMDEFWRSTTEKGG